MSKKLGAPRGDGNIGELLGERKTLLLELLLRGGGEAVGESLSCGDVVGCTGGSGLAWVELMLVW